MKCSAQRSKTRSSWIFSPVRLKSTSCVCTRNFEPKGWLQSSSGGKTTWDLSNQLGSSRWGLLVWPPFTSLGHIKSWIADNYNWAKISSVPDTSVTYFVLHSLNQFSDETKQCMPVQINSWAKFCSTRSFWYAVWFFELSWLKGCVSSGHLKYHTKNNRGKANVTAKPFKYLWYHQLITFICISFQYPALFWNPISIPV